MLFSLEVLKARHGDCLLLHYGTVQQPKTMLIDGGPSGIFNEVLEPRMVQIRQHLNIPQLPLSLVMVSHIDDDHINGIQALTDEMIQLKANGQPATVSIGNLWCNSFDDIVGNIQLPKVEGKAGTASVSSVANSTLPAVEKEHPHIAAVISSIAQGRRLRNNAKQMSLLVNSPFKPIDGTSIVMVRGDVGMKPIKFDKVKITILHPNAQRLEKLQNEWDKQLTKAAKAGDKTVKMAAISALLTSKDTSPYNLSSIVCLVESGTKKILLTGDARMDDIEAGLKAHGLLKNGKMEVDVFKLPHHGSIRNATADLLKIIKAKHYVISADGKFDNPDKPLLDLLAKNITSGTVHFTYQTGQKGLATKLKAFEKKLNTSGSAVKVAFRKEADLSLVIDLDDKLAF